MADPNGERPEAQAVGFVESTPVGALSAERILEIAREALVRVNVVAVTPKRPWYDKASLYVFFNGTWDVSTHSLYKVPGCAAQVVIGDDAFADEAALAESIDRAIKWQRRKPVEDHPASQRPDGDRRAADRVAGEGLGAEFARLAKEHLDADARAGTNADDDEACETYDALALFTLLHHEEIAAALSAVVPEARATEASPDLRALAGEDDADLTALLAHGLQPAYFAGSTVGWLRASEVERALERALVRPQGVGARTMLERFANPDGEIVRELARAHAKAEYPEHAWIAFDLDGTLARYDGWVSPTHIGEPVPAMVTELKRLRAEGWAVRIFTARVGENLHPTLCPPGYLAMARAAIEAWCLEHLGEVLPITASKDFGMVNCYDDRVKQVEPNTGVVLADALAAVIAERDTPWLCDLCDFSGPPALMWTHDSVATACPDCTRRIDAKRHAALRQAEGERDRLVAVLQAVAEPSAAMVERVARALTDANSSQPGSYDAVGPLTRDAFCRDARAAIAAVHSALASPTATPGVPG